VVLRHDTPRGVAISRNHGVFFACGDWVGLRDSDDLWHPRRIEAILGAVAERRQAQPIADEAADLRFGFAGFGANTVKKRGASPPRLGGRALEAVARSSVSESLQRTRGEYRLA
jgi:glycosyltransferase involved in cell wall biosynthesis